MPEEKKTQRSASAPRTPQNRSGRPYAGKPAYGAKSGDRKPSYGAKSAEKPAYGAKSGDRKPNYAPKTADKPAFSPKFGDKPAYPARSGDRKPASPAKSAKPALTARDAALKALADVMAHGAYASQAIDRQLDGSGLSPEDRRLATVIFYAAVENRLKIEAVLSPFVKTAPVPVVRDILHVACAQLLYLDRVPDHAAVDEAVKQTRRQMGQQLTGFVNVVLRNVIRARDEGSLTAADPADPVGYLSVEYSVARDLVETLIEAYGEDEARAICACRPKEHTQTVRPNLLTSSDEELERYLTENNVEWRKGVVPHSYLCTRSGALASMEGYRKGQYSLQGESSMLAAYAMQVKPGMNVLDACAAPGGKSALMCELMSGTGRVYSWDVHEHRVELIRAAGKRLRLYNLRAAARDARTPYESFDTMMNAVLVDAPCTGLGVMSDKPDIRTRFTKQELAEILPLQHDILANCARFVKVGGLLVYSTCTILPSENEEQVRVFLRENPQFAPDEDESWLPDALKGRMKDGMLQLMQHRDGVEGFFIARMRRKCL